MKRQKIILRLWTNPRLQLQISFLKKALKMSLRAIVESLMLYQLLPSMTFRKCTNRTCKNLAGSARGKCLQLRMSSDLKTSLTCIQRVRRRITSRTFYPLIKSRKQEEFHCKDRCLMVSNRAKCNTTSMSRIRPGFPTHQISPLISSHKCWIQDSHSISRTSSRTLSSF